MSDHFTELRLRLADTRATLRQAKDMFTVAQAEAEQHAIDNGLAGGKNAEERARSLTLALQKDAAYTGALSRLRSAEAECERIEALLESARDERRASEWQIRAQLADALFRAGIQSDAAEPAGESAFDDAVDSSIYLAQAPAYDDEIEIPF
jgi:hypothetical protein